MGKHHTTGHYNSDQPRDTDGRWIAVTDALGLADDITVHATDRVPGTGRVPSILALVDFGDGGSPYIALATPAAGGWNPVTSNEIGADGEQATGGYLAPHLSPTEAETVARHLAELADRAETGVTPPRPTRYGRAAQRIQHLVDAGQAAPGDAIGIGDEEDFPLTVREVLALLRDAAPELAGSPRRHVSTRAIKRDGGDTGTVWLDLEPTAGGTLVVVTAVEGDESPDTDYNRAYAASHTPAQARDLAARLRAFARTARRRTR